MRSWLAVLVVLLLRPLVGWAATPAVVLDSDGKSLVVIDVAGGTVGSKVALTDTPRSLLLSPDRTRIAVLSRGDGDTSFWTSTFHPKSKSSVTLIDAGTMKSLARTELGWDLGRAVFSNDGATLTVLTPGVQSNKANESHAAELIRIDANSGSQLQRIAFDRPAKTFDISTDGQTGVVFFKSDRARPAEVRFFDLKTMAQTGAAQFSTDPDEPVALLGDRLYLVDNKKANPGKVYVLSFKNAKLESTIDAGPHAFAGGVDPDSGTIYVLNDDSELRLVNGTAVTATIKVAPHPAALRLADDRKTAYVLSRGAVQRVDLATKAVAAPIEVRVLGNDFVATRDGRRGFVLHRSETTCCHLTVIDLPNNVQMKSFLTGSKAARIGQVALAVAASYVSYQSGRSAAAAHGGGTFYYTVYTPSPGAVARGPLTVRPDGKFAYSLDVQTNDVTVVDGESGERLMNIRVGSGPKELVWLGGAGRWLAAVSDASITVIDTDTNTVKTEVRLPGDIADFVLSPNGDYAVAVSREKVATIDMSSGTAGPSIDKFKSPIALAFLAP